MLLIFLLIIIVFHSNLNKKTGQLGNSGTQDVEIMVLLKYLSYFWGNLEMSLINLEIN